MTQVDIQLKAEWMADEIESLEHQLEQEEKASEMLVIERDDLQERVDAMRCEIQALDTVNTRLLESIAGLCGDVLRLEAQLEG